MLDMFSGRGRTKCFEVKMCWANVKAVDALVHAVGDYFSRGIAAFIGAVLLPLLCYIKACSHK